MLLSIFFLYDPLFIRCRVVTNVELISSNEVNAKVRVGSGVVLNSEVSRILISLKSGSTRFNPEFVFVHAVIQRKLFATVCTPGHKLKVRK